MLDDDMKNVKKIQDLLFENEEDDGIGRERKFRWKNQTDGFTIDDENAQDIQDNGDDVAADEESEMKWRKMRHERELLINEQSQKLLESDTISQDILLLDQNSQTVTSSNTSSLVKRKFQIIKTSSTSVGISSELGKLKDSPFLIKSSSMKFTNSFLSRDESTLNKIASFISNKDDEVTNMSSHGGGNSMSFAPIEKPQENNNNSNSNSNNINSISSNKRKSNEESFAKAKKRKVENQRLLLDQLR
jgi:hypothetical protein